MVFLPLLALASTAMALPARNQAIAARAAVVSVPASDPFYQPPAGYASTAPGTVLRNRTINASIFGFVPDPVLGYQLLYRTTAVNGTPIATVTTIFAPVGAHTDRFVSFQTAYDSSATMCDPSYTYQLGSPQTDLITSFESLILQGFLLSGYIVSAPDYEGPDAAFGPGHLEGMGVLDSMRAVENFGKTLGLSSNPKVVGYGYSGGAIATGWAASLQPSYAPSLKIAGWAAGGTPANLTGTMEFVDDTLFSGFLPAAFDGLLKPSAYHAQLQPLVNRIITPKGQSYLDYANTHCATDDIINFAEQSVLSTDFQTEGANIVYDPAFKSVLDANIMGLHRNETPTAPVFLFHAPQDEIIPYSNASTLFHNWCNNGASVHFTTVANGGHATTEVLGFPYALQFVNSAFAGAVPTSGCSQSTVLNNTLNPIALGADLEPLLTKLIDGLNVAGQMDINIINDLKTLLMFA